MTSVNDPLRTEPPASHQSPGAAKTWSAGSRARTARAVDGVTLWHARARPESRPSGTRRTARDLCTDADGADPRDVRGRAGPRRGNRGDLHPHAARPDRGEGAELATLGRARLRRRQAARRDAPDPAGARR